MANDVALEVSRAGDHGDGLFAGVDEVGSTSALDGVRADAEQAVLGLEHHLHAGGDVVGHERRDADAEVDVEAVAQLLGGARVAIWSRVSIMHQPPLRTVRRSMRFW
jgi:hypothetical protein